MFLQNAAWSSQVERHRDAGAGLPPSAAAPRRWRRSGLHMFGGRAPSIPQVNRMILKTEAEFLFDTLRAGEDRGLGQRGSIVAQDEIAVSMQALVMRITGLGQKVMENLRLCAFSRSCFRCGFEPVLWIGPPPQSPTQNTRASSMSQSTTSWLRRFSSGCASSLVFLYNCTVRLGVRHGHIAHLLMDLHGSLMALCS